MLWTDPKTFKHQRRTDLAYHVRGIAWLSDTQHTWIHQTPNTVMWNLKKKNQESWIKRNTSGLASDTNFSEDANYGSSGRSRWSGSVLSLSTCAFPGTPASLHRAQVFQKAKDFSAHYRETREVFIPNHMKYTKAPAPEIWIYIQRALRKGQLCTYGLSENIRTLTDVC